MDISIKTTVTGIFKKKIKFEIEYENVTEYAYSIADLVLILSSKKFEINEMDMWSLLNGIEQKYFKIK